MKCDVETYLRNVIENQRGNPEWTIQRNWQHWVHKTTTNKQSRDTGNIGYTRRRQTNNPETLATLGTKDDDKQTNKHNTTQYLLDTTIQKQTQINKDLFTII